MKIKFKKLVPTSISGKAETRNPTARVEATNPFLDVVSAA
jgi:hypothetical protein